VNAGVDDIGPDRRHIIVAVSRDARRQPTGTLEYFTALTLRPVGIAFPVLPFGPALHSKFSWTESSIRPASIFISGARFSNLLISSPSERSKSVTSKTML
jgi:hypothetical protein